MLTPTDAKSLKKDLAFLTSLYTNLRTKFSFKKVKTFRECLLAVGYQLGEIEYYYSKEQLDRDMVFSDLKEMELNAKLRKENEYNVKRISSDMWKIQAHEYEGYAFRVIPPSNTSIRSDDIKQGSASSSDRTNKEQTPEEYPILHSPHQKAKLFKFQNKASCQIINKVIDTKTLSLRKRAVLLRAGVGTGKTFILAAVLRQLEDMKIRQHYKILSPWPIVWITRASIVEQTRRVCSDLFGLDTTTTVQVINIEQLRAKFGDWMIAWETIVKGGEEHITCKWKYRIHPFIFVVDECQLAKNEDSTQSKIIQMIAEIPISEPVIMICSSATPFTRVIESKYFAINTWKNI